MCFKSKVKTPKTDPDSLKAPEPVLIDEPKGVDFGDDQSTKDTPTGVDAVKVDKTETVKGDGSTNAVASDTGMTVKKTGAPIKRAIKKATQ